MLKGFSALQKHVELFHFQPQIIYTQHVLLSLYCLLYLLTFVFTD